MKIKTININWNCKKSIEAAEKTKAEYENAGLTQITTIGGTYSSTLVYANKKEQKGCK